MKYICPMCEGVEQTGPGKCPRCGMDLIPADSVPKHEEKNSYKPLFLVLGLITLTTGVLTLRDSQNDVFDLSHTISYFMIGFFLTFSGFKLLDPKGFAEGYRTYDLLAKRVPVYAYIYPFIELFFGLSMILFPENKNLLWAEFVVMAFSGLGVVIEMGKGRTIQCVCLGTFLKVPFTKVTLIEDFGMATLALLMIFL